MNLSAQKRTDLISCIEAGAAARCSNIDHDANPHLALLRVLATDVIRPRNLNILRIEEWWDGWETTQQRLAAAYETHGYTPRTSAMSTSSRR